VISSSSSSSVTSSNIKKSKIDCKVYTTIENRGFTYNVRAIDQVLHDFQGTTYEDFLVKQAELITLVLGCEKEIFNDPSVFYLSKPHLQGKTGTMSTILTNGYLFLYNQLVEADPTLQVNADVDLRILIRLAMHSRDTMPDQEKEYLRSIVQKLKPKRKTNILSPEWFAEWKAAALKLQYNYSDLDFYKNDTVASAIKFFQSTEAIDFSEANFSMGPKQKSFYQALENQGIAVNKRIQEIKEELVTWVRKGYFPDPEDEYRLWELYPPYLTSGPKFDDQGNMFMDSFDEFISVDIPYLERLFTF